MYSLPHNKIQLKIPKYSWTPTLWRRMEQLLYPRWYGVLMEDIWLIPYSDQDLIGQRYMSEIQKLDKTL